MPSFGSKIPKPLQEELKRRELLSARILPSVPIPGAGKNAEFADYASKTHYAIMSTNRTDNKQNIAISAGEVSSQGGNLFTTAQMTNMAWGFSGTGEGAYRNTEAGSKVGIRPVAGLKSVVSEFSGDTNFFLRDTTVQWVAPTLESLEQFGAFLRVGGQVAVQWGFIGATTTLDANEGFIKIFDDRIYVDPSLYNNPRQKIILANGNMDAIGGPVVNFSFNLRDDGGFDCTTQIKSVGSSIFSADGNEDIDGLGAVLPKDVENELQKYADGLLPKSIDLQLDKAVGTISQVVNFVAPFVGGDDSDKKVSGTEDHFLNAILNLDNICDAHLSTNGSDSIVDNIDLDSEKKKGSDGDYDYEYQKKTYVPSNTRNTPKE